jgi:hypothetical protein
MDPQLSSQKEGFMEISKSISFITEDPRWQQKLLIGTGVVIASLVLSVILVGIVGFLILAGYCIRLLQNVRDGQTYPLPEWDQWGEDLARGFKLIVATLVWSLPVLILIIPTAIGNALASSNNEGAQFIGAMLSICSTCLTLIYGLLLAVVTPGISIAFARDEQITSALQFREILAWTQANIGQVLVVTLVYIAASIVLSIVGSIVGVLLCVVGLIITIPLATLLTSLFQYHLYGQLAYAYPMGHSGGDTGLTVYTSPEEMAPGVTPTVPPTTTTSDTPVTDTTDYPDSGVDNPTPPPAV